jgi:LysM repeat protein
MNPRLRGTPDEERARTDAMMKQRAADRANAPKPQPIDAETRGHLQDQLKSLEAKFDPNYEYSDDHGFWKEQSSIAQQINRIKAELSRGISESRQRKLNEARLLEDPVYRNFKVIGRYIAERKLTEPEILKVFADAEAGMTDKATGANRTFLGRGKDTTMDFAGGVADALKGVWSGIQSSTPISLVDVAYDKATDAMADLTGGQKGAVMQAINKYRMLAKEYPKTAGLAKGALVAITGLATGGAGLPAVAALVYGLDSAIKGEKFSDIALKAGGAAATAWAASKLASAFGSQPAPSDASAGSLDAADQVYQGAGGGASGASVPVDGGTYTIMQGDQLGYIAQAQGTTPELIRAANPDIDFSKALQKGMEIKLPPAGTPGQGSLWADYQGGMYGDKAAMPELLGGPGAGDVAAAASVPTPSPLNLQPPATPGGPQFGTVNLPDGQTLKAAAFPEGGITPRLPVGSTPVTINYNGQELTGRIVNDTVYFTKFPADAAAGTTSSAGTLSGVTGQQIAASPVYQQVYAQEIAKWGAEPSARAIQAAQTIATAKAKAAMVGAVRENTDWISTVKMRRLPLDRMIDQKLTTLSWALNESVGKPQGRSMHLTPLGVYTVFENIRRVEIGRAHV